MTSKSVFDEPIELPSTDDTESDFDVSDDEDISEDDANELEHSDNGVTQTRVHCKKCDFTFIRKLNKNHPNVHPKFLERLALHYDDSGKFVAEKCLQVTKTVQWKSKYQCGNCAELISREDRNDKTGDRRMVSCSYTYCVKSLVSNKTNVFWENQSNVYHRSCVEQYNKDNAEKPNLLFKFTNKTSDSLRKKKENRKYTESLTCPRFRCEAKLPKHPTTFPIQFIQCLVCDRSYHNNETCLPDEALIFSADRMLCPEHKGDKIEEPIGSQSISSGERSKCDSEVSFNQPSKKPRPSNSFNTSGLNESLRPAQEVVYESQLIFGIGEELQKSSDPCGSFETAIQPIQSTQIDRTKTIPFEFETELSQLSQLEISDSGLNLRSEAVSSSQRIEPSQAQQPATQSFFRPVHTQDKINKGQFAKSEFRISTFKDIKTKNILKLNDEIIRGWLIYHLHDLPRKCTTQIRKKYKSPYLIISKMSEVSDTMELKSDAELLEKGETICEYPAKLVDLKQLERWSSKEVIVSFHDLFFPFMVTGKGVIDSGFEDPLFLSVKVNGAHGQLIASSCLDCRNVELVVRQTSKTLVVKALQDLKPGDRLFLGYGKEYWRNATDVKDPICPICKKLM